MLQFLQFLPKKYSSCSTTLKHAIFPPSSSSSHPDTIIHSSPFCTSCYFNLLNISINFSPPDNIFAMCSMLGEKKWKIKKVEAGKKRKRGNSVVGCGAHIKFFPLHSPLPVCGGIGRKGSPGWQSKQPERGPSTRSQCSPHTHTMAKVAFQF